MKKVEVKLFGAFRKYIPDGKIAVEVSESVSAIVLKQLIHEKLNETASTFSGSSLVFESALANDDEILHEDALVQEGASLALLPPVCGG